MIRQNPDNFATWQEWARASSPNPVGMRKEPDSVLLAHKVETGNLGTARAGTAGVLLYDPALDLPVFADGTAWVAMTPTTTETVRTAGALMDDELTSISAVKALSDYEEGTFTPIFTDGTNNAATYTHQTASYTKIGQLVAFNIRLQAADLGSMAGAVVRIANLPFVNTASYVSVDVGYGAGLAIAQFSNIGGYIIPDTSTINLTIWASTAGILNLSVAELSSDGYVMVSGTYNAV